MRETIDRLPTFTRFAEHDTAADRIVAAVDAKLVLLWGICTSHPTGIGRRRRRFTASRTGATTPGHYGTALTSFREEGPVKTMVSELAEDVIKEAAEAPDPLKTGRGFVTSNGTGSCGKAK